MVLMVPIAALPILFWLIIQNGSLKIETDGTIQPKTTQQDNGFQTKNLSQTYCNLYLLLSLGIILRRDNPSGDSSFGNKKHAPPSVILGDF